MIYTSDKPPYPGGCHVLDANGLEWFHVVEMDTTTGRIIRHQTDDQGRLLISAVTGEILREEVWAAPPLFLHPRGKLPADPRHLLAGTVVVEEK